MSKPERTSTHFSMNESLLFEEGSPGRCAFDLPQLDVPRKEMSELMDPELLRSEIPGMPELSEVDVIRHFTRLSSWNYHIDLGLYPLGSCTMKYNPKINERMARLEGFALAHPYLPGEMIQGALEVQKTLENCLAQISGMDAVTLQPAAGAHGELTGILMVRAYHQSRGNPRKKILIPDSAHGTNPASAAIAGYVVESVPSNNRGTIDSGELRKLVNDDVAAIMITNPNTLGIFESEIAGIAESVHAHGALVYMDGANLNAMMGITRPGDFGIDVLHINLHKTFTTPHGGGGPGSGPVAVKKVLEPFLPYPVIQSNANGSYSFNYDRPHSIGKVKAYNGQFGMHVRALCYILANGAEGLKEVSEVAVLNANYIRSKLKDAYALAYDSPSLHEVVFSDRLQARKDVHVWDIAKRLMDYGFHPPTVSFPLIVPGAIMIEPTETESKQELDAFIEAMLAIEKEAEQNPELVKSAPHTTRVGRIDEAAAARKPVLRWRAGG
ncbi:MAG: aminomethyl-transferring glycine dehydrogenase subunit GcvPB [Acidobacteria bacterium]|nr:MAG: aminomethyl-transferring glycine dehydrogenase subunit GcvPB [Acidobacteriota bacterium]